MSDGDYTYTRIETNYGPSTTTSSTANPSATSTREAVLRTAIKYVTKDRNADHGEPEDTFATIAALWSAYKHVHFSETDVAMMQALLKIGRQSANPVHIDNYIDLAGYAACAAELADPRAEER